MWRVLGNSNVEEVVRGRKPAAPLRAPIPPNAATKPAASSEPAAPLLCGKYVVGEVLKHGATGVLYKGQAQAHESPAGPTPSTGSPVTPPKLSDIVLKLELCAAPKRQMDNEWQVYRALEDQRLRTGVSAAPLPGPNVGGFPEAEFDSGEATIDDATGEVVAPGSGGVLRPVNVLAMKMLGDNLMALVQKHRGRFSLKTCYQLGLQMVDLLQMMHGTGYIHRDIKPENFCVGRGAEAGRLFLIDYGLACKFLDEEGRHLPADMDGPGSRMVGSVRYMGVTAHQPGRQSRRCGCESVGYVLAFLCNGKLPWQGMTARTTDDHLRLILQAKQQNPPEQLCQNCPAIGEYLSYCQGLRYEQEPDYDRMRGIFTEGLKRRGFPPRGGAMDWQAPGGAELRHPQLRKPDPPGKSPRTPTTTSESPITPTSWGGAASPPREGAPSLKRARSDSSGGAAGGASFDLYGDIPLGDPKKAKDKAASASAFSEGLSADPDPSAEPFSGSAKFQRSTIDKATKRPRPRADTDGENPNSNSNSNGRPPDSVEAAGGPRETQGQGPSKRVRFAIIGGISIIPESWGQEPAPPRPGFGARVKPPADPPKLPPPPAAPPKSILKRRRSGGGAGGRHSPPGSTGGGGDTASASGPSAAGGGSARKAPPPAVGGAARPGGDAVDVAAALAKIVPHLGSEKKQGKAVALLADLMAAKICAGNSAQFHAALSPLCQDGQKLKQALTCAHRQSFLKLVLLLRDRQHDFVGPQQQDVTAWLAATEHVAPPVVD